MESEINKAVAYVSNNMDADELKVIKAQVNLAWETRQQITTSFDDEVEDLMEEFGEENDLPEGWWLNDCELDEVLIKLALII